MAVTYRLKHVGINCENEAEAKKLVSLLCLSLIHISEPTRPY